MIDLNVLNYFLIVLGGFSVVWTFKKVSGRGKEKIGEFEYAAFSAIWGIPVFLIFVWIIRDKPEAFTSMMTIPMTATPALILIGSALGAFGGELWQLIVLGRDYLARKRGLKD